MPENQKPRIANDKYDFLYTVGRGTVALYDPIKHGIWEIADDNCKLIVRQTNGCNITAVPIVTTRVHRAVHIAPRRFDIESPNHDSVLRYIKKWNCLENYTAQEYALNKLFWEYCPHNNKLDDVLLKVASLNAFYSTNIYNVYAVAHHIVSLGIDERLRQGDESLVMDIATGHGIKYRNNGKEISFYSFATKYCSRHRPEIYPIYDSFVEELLVYLKKKDNFADFKREDLKNSSKYRRILLSLQIFYSLESFTLKEIDQYLWQYGKEKFPKKY
jgi:hypothetical protein